MTKRFKMAYDALTQAFFEGTLAKWDCAACAVGNIVGAANNCRLTKEKLQEIIKIRGSGDFVFPDLYVGTSSNLWRTGLGLDHDPEYLVNEVASTGYTGEELRLVETAFEKNTKIRVNEYLYCSEDRILNDQYNGLCAAFEVLEKLDGVHSDYKEKLQSHPKLVLA